ncbi:16S rRNA (uracil(1498)-N(3))-methyltransferase [Dictyobacter aurantiacus]|uniref:Ribosomal RNA small subunit methyltransferase E n=1 Tax=Dictyobacter aurantiacus TaxID=1936993 RepID=A0A401ZF07_9CHLR|nr:16S rRNA (uracil(1498)-N(3))-methyltransferase [Dictyobacter aurantiacus]GCE05447.1 ribosomal RNA small subunit methyltransferase E [Dictyobacter aurantiacus]
MHRFFSADTNLQALQPGETVALPDKLAHQVRDVLHITVGEQIVLFDNSGEEYVCSVTHNSRAGIEIQLDERRASNKEPEARVILCQGLLKSARFEFILEKGTELGVTSFVPTLCRRSMSGLEEAGPKKLQRWERIIQEATEQCGRSRVPELQSIRPLMHTLNDIPDGALAIMPWEEEHAQSLYETLKQARRDWSQAGRQDSISIVIFIGPEGGLTTEEVTLARRAGVKIVTLGSRILRAETAALMTVANVMYELESLA